MELRASIKLPVIHNVKYNHIRFYKIDAIAKAKDYNKDVSIVFSSGVEYVCDMPYDELEALILRNKK
tara:strand:+ start:3701 stop:3901 length:201 start_codon:yes stop_codon:yes gene_type:complete